MKLLQLFICLASALAITDALDSYGPIGKDEVCKIDYFAKEAYGKSKFCYPCRHGFENKSPETSNRCYPKIKKPKKKELKNTITNAELPMPKDKELVESKKNNPQTPANQHKPTEKNVVERSGEGELPTENKTVHMKNEKGSKKVNNGSKTNSSDLDDGIENDPENDTEGSNKKTESNLETDPPTPDTNVKKEGSNGLSPGIIALIAIQSVVIILLSAFLVIEVKTGCIGRKLNKRGYNPGVRPRSPGTQGSTI